MFVPCQLGTPLHEAAAEGEHKSVSVLLEALGISETGPSSGAASPRELCETNAAGMTPLLMAAAGGRGEMVRRLIRAGSPLGTRGVHGMTVLHFVADRGDSESVEQILASDEGVALAGVKNEDDLLPLQLAAGNRHDAVVDLLWEASVDALPAGSTNESVWEAETARADAEHAAVREQAEVAAAKEEDRLPTPPPAQSEEDKEAADALKEEGNELFRAGRASDAIEVYTRALEKDGQNEVVWSNRSAAKLKAGDAEGALYDGKMARKLAPSWTKGLFRMGRAHLVLRQYEEAARAFWEGYRMEHSDDFAKLFQKAVELGRAEYERQKKNEGMV